MHNSTNHLVFLGNDNVKDERITIFLLGFINPLVYKSYIWNLLHFKFLSYFQLHILFIYLIAIQQLRH